MKTIPNWIARALLLTGGVVVLVTGGAILVFRVAGKDWATAELVPQVEKTLSDSLKRPVKLGPVEELLPWQIQLGRSQVTGLATVEQIRVNFSPWDLGKGQPLPIGLELITPSLQARQRANGTWEGAELLQNAAPPQNQPVLVKQVRLRDGKIQVLPTKTPAFTLAQVQGEVTTTGIAAPLAFTAQGTLDRAPWRVMGQIQPTSQTATARVELTNVPVMAPFALLNLGDIFWLKGRATGGVTLNWVKDLIPVHWDGQLRIAEGTAWIGGLPRPATAIEGMVYFQQRDIKVNGLRATYGSLPLVLSGALQQFARLEVGLRGERLDLTALQKTFELTPPLQLTGQVQTQLGIRGPLNNLVMAGDFRELQPGKLDRVTLDTYRGKVQLEVAKGLLRFPEVTVTGAKGTLQAQGDVQLSTGALRFQGNARNLQGQSLWQTYQGNPNQRIGVIGAKFQVEGYAKQPLATVQWQIQGGDWPGLGTLQLADNRYEVTQATFQKLGGQLQATALLRSNRWTAQLTPENIKLEQLFPGTKIADQPLQGPITGTINATGDWGKFQLSQLQANGNVVLPRGIGLVQEPIRSRFVWDGQQATISTPTPARIALKGTVKLTDSLTVPRWDLQLTTNQLPLQSVRGLNPPLSLQGLASIDALLQGNPTAPQIQGTGSFQNIRAAGVTFGTLQGRFGFQGNEASLDLKGKNSQVQLALRNAQVQRVRVQRDKTLLTGSRQGEALVGELRDFPLDLVAGSLDLPPGFIQGQVSGSYRLGVVGTPWLEGQLALSKGHLGPIPLTQAEAGIQYRQGFWQVSQGLVQLPNPKGLDSVYTLDGQWDSRRNYLSAHLKTSNGQLEGIATALDLRTWQEVSALINQGFFPRDLGRATQVGTVQQRVGGTLQEQLQGFTKFLGTYNRAAQPRALAEVIKGQFQADIALEGPLNNLDINFAGGGTNWQVDTVKISELQTKGHFRQATLQFNQLDVRLASDKKERTAFFVGSFSPQSQQGKVTLNNFPAGLSRYFVPERLRLRGDLSLTAALAGTRTNPTLKGDFDIQNASLNRAPLKQAQGGLGYREGRVSLFDVLIATGQEPARINGSFPFPLFGAVLKDRRVRMQLDVQDEALSLINLFTDQVQWQEGKGDLDLQIGGTSQALDLQGTLKVNSARLNLAGFGEPLTQVEAGITFQGNIAQIDTFNAQVSGGQVRALPGTLALLPSPNDNTRLTLNLEKLALRIPKLYEGQGQGQLIIQGSILAPVLSGRINLENGRFSLPDRALAQQNTDRRTSNEETIQRIATPVLKDLEVVLGDRLTLIQQPVLRVDTRGTLVLNGSLDKLQPQGDIQLFRGRVNLFPTPFNLDNTRDNFARFRPGNGLDPELSLSAIARVNEVSLLVTGRPADNIFNPFVQERTLNRGIFNSVGSQQSIRITAEVTGRISKPNLELRSSPPRSEAEIIALLGGSNATQSLLETGASFVSSPLLSPIEEFFLNNLAFDEFRIAPTTRTIPGSNNALSLGVGLEVGRDIGRQFSISLSQSLTDPTQNTRINLRYRLSEQVQLRFSTDFKQDVSASLEFETRF